MTEAPEHAPPASLADVYARLRELAPDPDPAAPDPAGTLTRYLAARTWYRWAKDQAQPDELLSADAYAALVSGFTALHAFRALEIARPILAAAVAREIASARADAGDVGEILFTHLTLLGVDAGEIKRLAEAAVALERAKADAAGAEEPGDGEETPEALRAELEALRAKLARTERGAQTLGLVVTRNAMAMEAARIEMCQNDPHAAMQWILNSIPDVWDNEPGTEWDGTETANQWMDRTFAAERVNDSSPVRWLAAVAPGGWVCAVPDPDRPDGICGHPVESEPCPEHRDPAWRPE